ncbi:MAG: Ig-like domain-containing protein [Candidatus Limnocylindrales bacterium]
MALMLGIALQPATFAFPLYTLHAATPVKPSTVLRVEVPPEIDLGSHPRVDVELTSGGAPVPGQLVSITIETRVSIQLTTGIDGRATGTIEKDLVAGSHDVIATFAGSPAFRSSSSMAAILSVRPAELTIATVPPLPNLPLVKVAGGKVLTTSSDGSVHVSVTSVGKLELALALPAEDTGRRVSLDHWDDGSINPTRTIRVPTTFAVTVGLVLSYPVELAFSAADGTVMDSAEVPLVRISDGAGAERDLTGPAPYWLPANNITRVGGELVSTGVEYRVVSVPLDGLNVVNRGQQRFFADRAKRLDIHLLVFNLQLQGRDALLRTAAGSQVKVTSPSGSSRLVKLDGSARGALRLPRGVYRLELGGGLGIALSTPVALSRDQTVDVMLLSALDIGLVVGLAGLLALALIVFGRPHVLRRGKARGQPPEDPEPQGPSWPESPPPVPPWSPTIPRPARGDAPVEDPDRPREV